MRKQKYLIIPILVLLVLTFSIKSNPVFAAEWENIDSFDVHPDSGRWATTASGSTATIHDSMLNVTDTGDGSNDYYELNREIRDLEGGIEIAFKVDSEGEGVAALDALYIEIGESTAASKFLFNLRYSNDSNYWTTLLRTQNVDATTTDYALSGDERVFDNVWYKLLIDYSIPKSQFEFTLHFLENNSKLWDYRSDEITTKRPKFFNNVALTLYIKSYTTTNGLTNHFYFDYVKASFKQRQWESQRDSADADWIERDWQYNIIDDDIDDYENWRLNTPKLDNVKGSMLLQSATQLNPGGTGEYFAMYFMVNTVDYDDAQLNTLFYIAIKIQSAAGGGAGATLWIYQAGGSTTILTTASTDVTKIQCDFQIDLAEDRNKLIFTLDYQLDGSGVTSGQYGGSIEDITASYTDASQEFILETYYDMDFDDNIQVMAAVPTLNIGQSDWLTDWILGLELDAFQEAQDQGGNAIEMFINFMQNLIGAIQEIFDNAVGILVDLLSDPLGFIEDAVNSISTQFVTWLDSLVADLGSLISWIGDFGSDLIDWIVSGIGELIDAALSWFFDIVAEIVDFLALVFHTVYDFLWIDIMGADSAFNVYQLLLDIFEFCVTIMEQITTLLSLFPIIGFALIFGLPLLLSGPMIGEYLDNVIKIFFKDLTMGLSLPGGIHIPVPLGVLWLISFQTEILVDTVFGGFLAW